MSDLSDIQKQSLKLLEQFIIQLEKNPNLLHMPDLNFFCKYIESLGGKVPPKTMLTPEQSTEIPEPEVPPKMDQEIESEESDVDIDNTGCIEPDIVDENIQIMGDDTKEVTEEDIDKSNEIKREAMSFFGEGEYEKAIGIFTKAILENPKSAMLYTKRGQCFLKMNKPNACIVDCTQALTHNADYAAAYKYRGRSYRLLGEWEKSAHDLRQACKIDLDEEVDEWLKEVQKNALALESHRIKQERKKLDMEEKLRRERIAKAREAHAKAAETASSDLGGDSQGLNDFMKIFQNAEIMEALQDPEIAQAFKEVSENPANVLKYQKNPKIMAFVEKISKLGGLGGMAGFPGMGGVPGFGTKEGSMPDDDGLD